MRRAEKLKRGTKEKAWNASICPCGAAENQRLMPLPVDLPAPEAIHVLPAPTSDEGMVVDPEIHRRKRPREELDVDAQPPSGNDGAGAQSSRHDNQQQESETVEVLLAMATSSVQGSQETYVEVEDDTVMATRTDVIVQRTAKVKASQTTTMPTPQRRSTVDRSQPPTKWRRPSIKEWEPYFRNQQ